MDPYARLGVSPDADLATLRAARRELAKTAHPDQGGDPGLMRDINEAFDVAVRRILRPDTVPEAASPSPPPTAPPTRRRWFTPPAPPRPVPSGRWVEHDRSTFVVHCLPVEAFELLLVATASIGELIDDDPPYAIEVLLGEPIAAWCRLELVPDAGASTVSVTVVSLPGRVAPTVEAVRDAWVDALNDVA